MENKKGKFYARVVKLVDAPVLETGVERRASSSLASCTQWR